MNYFEKYNPVVATTSFRKRTDLDEYKVQARRKGVLDHRYRKTIDCLSLQRMTT